MKMQISTTKDTVTASLDKIAAELDKKLAQLAYEHWKKITPIDKGNARRRTRLQNSSIVAAYPYAQRLDEGWSKQAPHGMSKPTLRVVERELAKMMRK